MNAPLHFKQQLADELNARATVLAAPTGHRARIRAPRRRLTFTLGAVAAAVAVAVAVPLAGGTHGQAAAGSSTAQASPGTGNTSIDIVTTDYTVKSSPDGILSVELLNVRGIPALQAALRQAGIPAAVMEFSASCHAKVDTDVNIDPEKVFPQPSNGRYALVRLSAVPKGEHLLFMEMMTPVGGLAPSQMSVVRQVPKCVPESDNEIGYGYVAPGTNP
ncbi:hypothetical protein GXW82_33570 [Streptacidiphilus sp. 4-A2]|nr:hypothetical protein [Streptacidiphilus sp. 4-A2]